MQGRLGNWGKWRIIARIAMNRSLNGAFLFQMGNATTNGVLNDRLKKETRNQTIQRRRCHFHLHFQTVREANLFDCQIILDELQLAGEWDLLRRPPDLECLEKNVHVRKRFNVLGLSPKFDERGNCIERIEQEVRFHLHLQRSQMLSGELPLQLQ